MFIINYCWRNILNWVEEMNNKMFRAKRHINRQKKKYIALLSIVLIGIIIGFSFYFMISDSDKLLVLDNTTKFFEGIQGHNINYLNSIINSSLVNFLYVIVIFILGISVVGLIFIIGILLIKSFIIGFSFASIIATFKLKGLILGFIYIFPHQVLYMTIIILMSFYACNFCTKLFGHLFTERIVNFKVITKRYVFITLLSLIVSLICSLYEVFVATYLIDILI